MSSASDIRYGRKGGNHVPWTGQDRPGGAHIRSCRICGGALLAGQRDDVHGVCIGTCDTCFLVKNHPSCKHHLTGTRAA